MEAFKAILHLDSLPQTTAHFNNKREEKRQTKTPEDNRNSPLICVVLTSMFIVFNVLLRVLSAWYVRTTQLHVFSAWMQSFLALGYLWRRERRRLRHVLRSIKSSPGVYWYAIFTVIAESCYNKLSGNSTGPEIIQLGITTSPLFVVMGLLWYERKTQPSIVMAFVVVMSLMMTIIVCSIDEPYYPFRFTFFDFVVGLFHGISTALMVLSLRRELKSEEISIVQQLFSFNLACVVLFPFVMMCTGEWSHLLNKQLPSNWLYVALTVVILAAVRLMDQASCLYHLKHTSCLVHIATRGLTWIPISLICIFTLKLELMIKSLVCFFLMLAVFLTVFVDKLTDVNV